MIVTGRLLLSTIAALMMILHFVFDAISTVGSRTVSPAKCRGRCKVGTGVEEDKRVLKGLQLALQGKAANFSIGNLFSVLHLQPFDNQVRSSIFPSLVDAIEAHGIVL